MGDYRYTKAALNYNPKGKGDKGQLGVRDAQCIAGTGIWWSEDNVYSVLCRIFSLLVEVNKLVKWWEVKLYNSTYFKN